MSPRGARLLGGTRLSASKRRPTAILVFTATLVCAVVGARADEGESTVDFNRDIRPILSDKCYLCHGPDVGTRKAGLRLDLREGMLARGRRGPVIDPGHTNSSELIRRVRSSDPATRMPPPDSGRELSPVEVELLTTWVAAGAPWTDHWAFVPPVAPAVPSVKNENWPRQPIDHFILARLEKEGLDPAPEADRRTLLRRVTLDLTGLPPTPTEIEAFLSDPAADAYERQVDRLLERPSYGEHMARFWLDAVRYGDTHGLHLDNLRSIWPYRDWVVQAMNDNKRFDRFTIEQLAGDLLPEPSLEQRIATGFVRSNLTTNEGGSILEEVYVRNVVDRVETTATVFLGVTAGCAVCHDHKFDPISQKEFYELFAFFNNGTDNPMDGNRADHGPVVRVPTDEQAMQLATYEKDAEAKRILFEAPNSELDAAQRAWEEEWHERLRRSWEILEPREPISEGGATLTAQPDRSVLATGKNPGKDRYQLHGRTELTGIVAIKLEALKDPSLPKGGTSRASHGNFVLSEFEVEAVSVADPSVREKVELVAAHSDYDQPRYPVPLAIDGKKNTGWAMDGRLDDHFALFYIREPLGFEGGTELHFTLWQEFGGQHNLGRIRLSVTTDVATIPAASGVWQSVGPFAAKNSNEAFKTDYGPEEATSSSVVYRDGELEWKLRPEFVDGRIHRLTGTQSATYLWRQIYSPTARKVTVTFGSDDGIRAWHDGELVLDKNVARGAAADQEEVVLELHPGSNDLKLKIVNGGGPTAFTMRRKSEDLGGIDVDLATILARPTADRSEVERTKLRDRYRIYESAEYRKLQTEVKQLAEKGEKLAASLPVSLVFQEQPRPKPAYLLKRGLYDLRGEEVNRGVPGFLPSLPPDEPRDRLGLARWLVSPENPLTARVTVNRYWLRFFGTGIVKTAEDFGSQGEWPSHPQLLDWLATEFVASGWDVKAMHRRLVTSATYRQSARVDPEKLRRDPENRLCARGPRFRLDAETIRDSALAMSGLLVDRVGGPPVKPYQPSGLWKAVGYTSSNTAVFKRDDGDALYRRSLYTFWKRTSPPPSMTMFDAPTRESCVVRRSRTNTPTAALTLLNDIQFVEAARAFAERLLRESPDDGDEVRFELAYLLATGRPPEADEVAVLREVLGQHLAHYRAHPEEAQKLIGVGERPVDTTLDPVELAAWTLITNLILNLDETITKG